MQQSRLLLCVEPFFTDSSDRVTTDLKSARDAPLRDTFGQRIDDGLFFFGRQCCSVRGGREGLLAGKATQAGATTTIGSVLDDAFGLAAKRAGYRDRDHEPLCATKNATATRESP